MFGKRISQIILAFLAGFIGVVFGVGGGIILVPALLFTGLKPKETVGTSLAIMVFISLSGTFQHLKMHSLNLSDQNIFLLAAGIIGAIIGSVFLKKSTSKTITFLIIAYFYIMGAFMVLNPFFIKAEFMYDIDPQFFWISGLVVAMISTPLGIGGGAMLTPALVYLFNYGPKEAVGVAMPFIFFLSLTATIINVKHKFIDGASFLIMMPAAVGGTMLAYAYFSKIQNIHVQIGIGALLVINALIATGRYITKRA